MYYEYFLFNRNNSARRRRLTGDPELDSMRGRGFSREWSPMVAFTPRVHRLFGSKKQGEEDREFKILSTSNSIDSVQYQSMFTCYDNVLVDAIANGNDPQRTSIMSKTNMKRVSVIRLSNIEKPLEIGNTSIKPPIEGNLEDRKPCIGNAAVVVRRVSRVSKLTTTDEDDGVNPMPTTFRQPLKGRSMSLIETSRASVIKLARNKSITTPQANPNNDDEHISSSEVLNKIKSESQRSKSMNMGNVSVRRVKRSSVSVIST